MVQDWITQGHHGEAHEVGRRPTPPKALDWSIHVTRGEATQVWIIKGSKAQD